MAFLTQITKTGVVIMGLPENTLFYGLRERMTEEQEYFANNIIDKHVVFSDSEAGTGKTTIAFASLYYLYETGVIDRILYITSPVEEDKMGFRPGTQKEKEAAYSDPIIDAIIKVGLMPEKVLDEKYGFVEILSHTFLRGTNKERLGIIIDEAQNYTVPELKKTLTRIHDTCHLVVTGHTGQCDLKNPTKSGFSPYLEHYAKLGNRVGICPLTENFRGWISKHADSIGN